MEPEPELRASDADRDAAVERLARAVSDGRLTLEEYTERSGKALECRTHGELRELTRDLPDTPAPRPAAPAHPVEELTAILGNESRKGRWTVPERLQVRSVLGDCHLEMQEALLSAPVTVIDVRVVLGACTVYVPEGVDVRLKGRAVLGEKSSKMSGAVEPGAPVIEVRCNVILGSVEVKPPEWRMRASQAVRQVVESPTIKQIVDDIQHEVRRRSR